MQLHSLTSLRFFAALLVVLHHLPGSPFPEGYSGVTFFFILSGFILAHRYTEPMRSGMPTQQFWIARIARVYPLHLLTMLLAAPTAWLEAGEAWRFAGRLAAQITLTQAFSPFSTTYFSFNWPSWSLSVEAMFYALFPVLVLARSRRLAWIVAAAAAWQFAMVLLPRGAHYFAYIFPFARLGDFAAGMLLYRVWKDRTNVSPLAASVAQVAGLGLTAVAYSAAAHVPEAWRYDVYYAIPMAIVVLACAWQQGIVSRLLSNRWLVLLGDASFALYLVHHRILRIGRELDAQVPGVVYVLVCVLAALLLHRYFELPAKSFTAGVLKRMIRRPEVGRLAA